MARNRGRLGQQPFAGQLPARNWGPCILPTTIGVLLEAEPSQWNPTMTAAFERLRAKDPAKPPHDASPTKFKWYFYPLLLAVSTDKTSGKQFNNTY